MAGRPYPMRYNPYRHRNPMSRGASIALGVVAGMAIVGIPVAVVAYGRRVVAEAEQRTPELPEQTIEVPDYESKGSVVLAGQTWDWEIQHEVTPEGPEFWWWAKARESGEERLSGGADTFDETLQDMFKDLGKGSDETTTAQT